MKRKWIWLISLSLLGLTGCIGSTLDKDVTNAKPYGEPVNSTIVPRVKEQYSSDNEKITFNSTVSYYVDKSEGNVAVSTLEIILPDIKWESSDKKDAALVLIHKPDISKHDEYYDLIIKPDCITLMYKDFLGARNGAATLAQLVTLSADGTYTLPCGEVRDYPETKHRSMMIESSGRDWLSMEEIKESLIRAAISKLNYVHFHFMEYKGCTIEFESYPELPGYGAKNLKYTKNEIREIVKFASSLGIELIPGIEMPAHGEALLNTFKELRCQPKNGATSKWVCCAGSVTTYEVFRNIINEVAELFPGKYIHIGGDELDFGEGSGWEPAWMNCERCQALCQRDGMSTEREIYYYMIRMIHGMVTEKGKEMIMFNDQIDISVSPDIPRDIIIQFWRIASPGRGPVDGCTFERFIKEGFRIINSYYPEMYVDEEAYANADSIRVWTPNKTPDGIASDSDKLILGGEFCAWGEQKTHYPYSFPSAIVLYGDRYWNTSSICEYDTDYGIKVTHAVLGADSPEKFNVYEFIGSIFPPRENTEMAYIDKIAASKEKMEHAAQLMENFRSDGYGADAAAAYGKCIRWAIEQMK